MFKIGMRGDYCGVWWHEKERDDVRVKVVTAQITYEGTRAPPPSSLEGGAAQGYQVQYNTGHHKKTRVMSTRASQVNTCNVNTGHHKLTRVMSTQGITS